MIPKKFQLKNTIKYPTSVIIGGANKLGVEIADSLIKQGGYVVIIDTITNENVSRFQAFDDNAMLSLLDYTSIPHLEEDIRRLDYVFYFNHESIDFKDEISTQEFLTISNYLDAALSLAAKFEARFLLTTSIKANQVLFASDDAAYRMSMSRNYTQTYSNMEMQRYSEGLVMEYHQKAGLNARIIRLGEIIGDGMDFDHKSAFVDLLVSALEKDNLFLRNDGLENEWFVHTLDAAYALIKAQFSKESNGQVYSVCYENTYTHLSIAYKIQELEDNAGEIKFVENKVLTPPIKLYKPAPNLSKIGWMPRISFDRAVTQSLASAKIYLLEKNVGRIEEHSEVGKLKNFLTLAGTSSGTKLRLASKQEHEESIKKERIKEAYGKIKQSKFKRQKTFSDKLKDWFWKFFKGMAGMFTFLRKMSPVEFGIFLLFFVIFIIAYFILLSPLLFIGRNIITISPAYQNSTSAIENSNFEDLNYESERIIENIRNIRESLTTLKIPGNIVSYSDEIDRVNTFLEYYEDYAEGIADISYSLMPYNEYLEELENNTALRKSNEGFLSLSSEGKSYSDILSEINNRSIYYDKGLEKVNRTINSIEENALPPLPQFISTQLQKVNSYLTDLKELDLRTKSYLLLPELLGNKEPITYLIFITDNTKPSPVGGSIASLAALTFQEGGLASVQVRSIDSVEIDRNSLNEDLLRSINARRFNYKNNENLNASDIGSIENAEEFFEASSSIFENLIGSDIDVVVTLNIEAFQELVSKLREANQQVLVGGVDFTNGEVLALIRDSQVGNESIESKNNIISELSASIINNGLTFSKNHHNDFEKLISTYLDNENMRIYSKNPLLNDLFNNSKEISILDSGTYLIPGILSEDPKVVFLDKYPNTTLSLETDIAEDLKIKNKLRISFPNIGSSQEISICLPDTIRISSIIINNEFIPNERTRININGNEICVVGNAITESAFELEWMDESLFSTDGSEVTLSFGIGNINGARTELDHVIRAERGLSVKLENGEEISSDFGKVEILNKDLVKKLIITRE